MKKQKIGEFYKDQEGYISGRIHALGIGVTSVVFTPAMSREDKPFFRVMAEPYGDPYEVGVAFEKVKDGKAYHLVILDGPTFEKPIKAALFTNDNKPGFLDLVWHRPEEAAPNVAANLEYAAPGVRRGLGSSAATP